MQLILAFIFFWISAVTGALLYKNFYTITIICPEGTLIQAMSDGHEVLCIYKQPGIKDKRIYKKGELRKHEIRTTLFAPYRMQNN